MGLRRKEGGRLRGCALRYKDGCGFLGGVGAGWGCQKSSFDKSALLPKRRSCIMHLRDKLGVQKGKEGMLVNQETGKSSQRALGVLHMNHAVQTKDVCFFPLPPPWENKESSHHPHQRRRRGRRPQSLPSLDGWWVAK